MTPAVLVASRSGGRLLLATAVLGGFSAVLSHRALKIDMTQQYAPALMTIPELCAVLLTCLGVVVLRPQLWIIDRLGVPSRRWVPSAAALLAGIVAPQLVLAAGVARAFPVDDWAWAAANVLFLTGLAYLVSPFIGAFGASGLSLMVYFTMICALQMEPAIGPWSPLTISTMTDDRWLVAVGTAIAAAAVTVRTLGRTRLTWGRDLDLA